MTAMSAGELKGVRRWAEDLVHYLDSHQYQESEILEAYEAFATEDLPEIPRYLVNLVVKDERDHHQALSDIREALRAMIVGESAPQFASDLGVPLGLKEQTEKFMEIERSDARELQHLLKKVYPKRDVSTLAVALSMPDDGWIEPDQVDALRDAARPISPALINTARLWVLLVRMQMLDTQKHELILDYLSKWCDQEESK